MNGLKAVLIHDKKSNAFTAFIADFPGVVIQTSSKDEVKKELDAAMDNFMLYLMRKRRNDYSFSEQNLLTDEA